MTTPEDLDLPDRTQRTVGVLQTKTGASGYSGSRTLARSNEVIIEAPAGRHCPTLLTNGAGPGNRALTVRGPKMTQCWKPLVTWLAAYAATLGTLVALGIYQRAGIHLRTWMLSAPVSWAFYLFCRAVLASLWPCYIAIDDHGLAVTSRKGVRRLTWGEIVYLDSPIFGITWDTYIRLRVPERLILDLWGYPRAVQKAVYEEIAAHVRFRGEGRSRSSLPAGQDAAVGRLEGMAGADPPGNSDGDSPAPPDEAC